MANFKSLSWRPRLITLWHTLWQKIAAIRQSPPEASLGTRTGQTTGDESNPNSGSLDTSNPHSNFPSKDELGKWGKNIILGANIAALVSLPVNTVFFGSLFMQQRNKVAIESIKTLSEIPRKWDINSCGEMSGPRVAVIAVESLNQAWISLNNLSLQDLDLRNAELNGASLVNAKLQCANLSGAKLENVDFSGADLSGATLSKDWQSTKGLKFCNTIGPDKKLIPNTANCPKLETAK